MSEEHNPQDSQAPQAAADQEDNGTAFNRGSALSLFNSDRLEDMLALIFALAIALYVYVNY